MSELVKVVANLTPTEAAVIHCHLAQHGIPSRVEGLELVTWLWYLSKALHGVSVVVRADDRHRAVDVLSSRDGHAVDGSTSLPCIQCGEILPANWCVCWRCGAGSEEDVRAAMFHEDEILPSPLLKHLTGVDFLGLWLLTASMLAVVVPPLALVYTFMLISFGCRQTTSKEQIKSLPDEFAAIPVPIGSTEKGDEICRRAMASAMFGLGWFPPLTFYSIWLMWRGRELKIGLKGRVWRIVAVGINCLGVAFVGVISLSLLWLLFDGLIDRNFSSSLGQFVNDIIDGYMRTSDPGTIGDRK